MRFRGVVDKFVILRRGNGLSRVMRNGEILTHYKVVIIIVPKRVTVARPDISLEGIFNAFVRSISEIPY